MAHTGDARQKRQQKTLAVAESQPILPGSERRQHQARCSQHAGCDKNTIRRDCCPRTVVANADHLTAALTLFEAVRSQARPIFESAMIAVIAQECVRREDIYVGTTI